MNMRKHLNSIFQQAPDMEAFKNLLEYFQDFTHKNIEKISSLAKSPAPKTSSTPEITKPYTPAISKNMLSQCISYGLKILGVSTFADTVNAQQNVSIVAGIPTGSSSECNDSYIKCAEAYIAAGKDVLARFLLAGSTAVSNSTSDAADYVSNCVAGNTEPLTTLISDMIRHIPNWQNPNVSICSARSTYPNSNFRILGQSTPILLAACQDFQAGVFSYTSKCEAGYVNSQNPSLSNNDLIKIALISTAASIMLFGGSIAAIKCYRNRNRQDALAPEPDHPLRQPLV